MKANTSLFSDFEALVKQGAQSGWSHWEGATASLLVARASREIDKLQQRIAELEAALGWCIEYQAIVKFFYLQGLTMQPRVSVHGSGGLIAERDDLIEAVDFLREKADRRKEHDES